MRRSIVLCAVVAAAGIAVSLAVTPSAEADEYPSWEEVQAARADVSTANAEVQRISGFIDQLTSEAATLGADTIAKGAAYNAAEQRLDEATARADDLGRRADVASAEADSAHRQYGRIISQMVISGGSGNLSARLFLSHSGDDLLYRLGAMSKLVEQSQTLEATARRTANEAASLREQAKVAESARASSAAAAEAASTASQRTEKAADDRLAAQLTVSTTLQAQLASLTDSAAAVRAEYEYGQSAKAEATAAAQAAAAEKAAHGASAGGSGTAGAAAGTSAGSSAGGSTAGGPGGASSGSSGSSSGSNGSAGTSGGSAGGSTGTPANGGGISTGDVVVNPTAARAYAQSVMGSYGWDGSQFACLVQLWNRESGWRANAYNASSKAYGIPQALPADRMASAGVDWRTNANTQINWGISYIKGRYGSPCGAWAHSESYNWY